MLDGLMDFGDVQRLGCVGQDLADGFGDFANAAWGRRRLARRFGGLSEQLLPQRVQARELIGGSVFGKCSREGYCDAEAFKRIGAIFMVIRCAAPDPLGGDRLGFLIGCTLVVKRFLS